MASSSSVLVPQLMKDEEPINWAEHPQELLSSILLRLGIVEILQSAQKVCRSWRRVCKDPSMWRKIDMDNLRDLGAINYDLEAMCRHAVDRSQGGLAKIEILYFGTDDLLNYLGNSSRTLRSLKLVMCYAITDEGFVEAVVKLPLLEDAEISYCSVSGDSLKVLGQSCPNMKTLKVNDNGYRRPRNETDDDAVAIAETMPGLRHLQLFGNGLTNIGLNAILDNCPNLEHLDLRQCFYVKLVGDLEKRCSERIKVLRHPDKTISDYPYKVFLSNSDWDDESDDIYDDYMLLGTKFRELGLFFSALFIH